MIRWDEDEQDRRTRPLTAAEKVGALLVAVFLVLASLLMGW